MCWIGAASDKVTALEKAGVSVVASPALVGTEMLKVTEIIVGCCPQLTL